MPRPEDPNSLKAQWLKKKYNIIDAQCLGSTIKIGELSNRLREEGAKAFWTM